MQQPFLQLLSPAGIFSKILKSPKSTQARFAIKKMLFLIALIGFFFSCKNDDAEPNNPYTRIYDSFRSDHSFNPIDIVATETGFLIIAGQTLDDSDFMGIQIIRLDEDGNYMETRNLSADYVIPVGDFIAIDSNYYFFAMQSVSLRAVLIKTTTSLTEPEVVPVDGIYYPLAASKTSDGNLLLLSYDLNTQQSVISKISTDGGNLEGRGYTIGAGSDVEASIISHYTDPERSALPFFCGELSNGQVYFNGIYNYSFSLVFSDFSDTPTGVVQGQNLNGGISSVLPITGSNFAVFGFQFNDNFIQPNIALNTTGISSSVNLLGSTISEFKSRTPARIKMYQLNNVEYIVFAAETESRQVALYFYEAASRELRGIHKIGYLNPYTLSAISVDSGNNLMVMGTTYVSGRFERIYVSKIPEKNVKGIVR